MQQQHVQAEYGAQSNAGTAGTAADAFAGHTQYDSGTGATPQGSSAEDESEPPFTPNRTSPR
jgi:hypothetical protein